MSIKTRFTFKQWTLFRLFFGSYFLYLLISLIINDRLFNISGLNGAYEAIGLIAFPGSLLSFSSPLQANIFLGIGVFFTILFILNILPRLSTIFVIFVWIGIHSKFLSTLYPHVGILSWTLLVSIFFEFEEIDGKKYIKYKYFYLIEFVTCYCLLMSGIHKLSAVTWRDGTALIYILDNFIIRPHLITEFFRSLPDIIIKFSTYLVLAIEILALPLLLIKGTKGISWILRFILFMSFAVFLQVTDIAIVMLCLTLLTVDLKNFGVQKTYTFFKQNKVK